MEEPYELKLLKQQLKQEFRRSTCGTENLEQLSGLSQHYYTPSSSMSSYSQRHYPKSDKYSISRLTLEKQAAKQLPASMMYQKHKTPLIDPKISSKYSSITDSRGLDTDYTSYLGSTSASPRSSRLLQDEITFGLRKNIAEQQKYLGSTLGANLAGSLNLGQSLGLDSAYPSGSRSRPASRPTSCYGLDLSIKRDPSSSSLRLKGDGESGDGPSYQTPSGRTKPTSLPIVQSGRGRIPIVAQNSEEESPLSPVGQPMGMARASAGPLPPISADSRDQFGSCLSLQDSQQQQQQQQHIREEPTRGRGYVLLDDLQGTMSDSEGKDKTCRISSFSLLHTSLFNIHECGFSCLSLVYLCKIFTPCLFIAELHVSNFYVSVSNVRFSFLFFWVSVVVDHFEPCVHGCLCSLFFSLCMSCRLWSSTSLFSLHALCLCFRNCVTLVHFIYCMLTLGTVTLCGRFPSSNSNFSLVAV